MNTSEPQVIIVHNTAGNRFVSWLKAAAVIFLLIQGWNYIRTPEGNLRLVSAICSVTGGSQLEVHKCVIDAYTHQ